ncbi:MAG: ribosomal-protein-alanine N-acetyltransferase [Chlamydiales bacterium]|jgi:ribosomal-protein-alanine N-acetyltransferase
MRDRLTLHAIENDGSVRAAPAPLSDIAQQVARATADMYVTNGFDKPWIGYLAALDERVVGTCGFKTPPRAGRVEIAYFTFPDFEGRGIATRMASALLALAHEQAAATLVAAQTLPVRNPSHRILEKLGFRHVDTIQHPEDGTVWEWQHDPRGAASDTE